MRRQFLRFYIGLFAAMTSAALVFSFLILGAFENAVDKKIEQFMAPLVEMIRERMAEAGSVQEEIDRELESINLISPIPVHISRNYEQFLLPEAVERLHNGKLEVTRGPGERSVYAIVYGGMVIHIGPIPFEGGATPLYVLMAPPILILLLSGFFIYLLIRPIERRISGLSEAARRFGRGDLSIRANVGTGGAIDELEGNFNWMADRIEGLVQGQKDLLRAVSHELRTPLARLFFMLDDAQSEDSAEKKNEVLKRIDLSLLELNDLVEELMVFLRLDKDVGGPESERIDVTVMLPDIIDLARDLRSDIQLEHTCDFAPLFGNPLHVKRAVVNLVTNGIRHARSRILITGRKEANGYRIIVEDDGPGIPGLEREKVFAPFYRLDPSRGTDSGGTGLGLAIVARIMSWHKGTVDLGESRLGGARFELLFPPERLGNELVQK